MKREIWKKAEAGAVEMLARLDDGVRGENNRGWLRSEVACMAIVSDDYTHVSPNQVCHAGLSNRGYDGFPRESRLAVINSIQRIDAVGEDVATTYMHWLANESPWSSTYVSKSARQIIKQKYSVHRTDVPNNLLAGGLIASRSLWEFPNIAVIWEQLIRRGVNPNLAYLMAHCGSINRGKYSPNGSSESHTAVDVSDINISNFVNSKPMHLQALYSVDFKYDGVNDTWGEGRGLTGALVAHFQRLIKGDGVGSEVNPFPVAHDELKSYELDEAMDCLASVSSILEEEYVK